MWLDVCGPIAITLTEWVLALVNEASNLEATVALGRAALAGVGTFGDVPDGCRSFAVRMASGGFIMVRVCGVVINWKMVHRRRHPTHTVATL